MRGLQMNKRRFRIVVTMILIASPIWWTSGCYSSYQITSPGEAADTPIEITTKGNNHYAFAEWTADSSGNIRGFAPFVVPVAVRSGGGTITQQQPVQIVPKDSIAAIHVQRVNVGATILTAILTTAAAVAGAALLFIISVIRACRN
jgi:hypothetical protein